MKRHRTLALFGMATLLLAGCGGGDEGAAPTPTQATPTSVREVEDLVREDASATGPVQNVLCSPVSDDLVFCAVTFTGPSCELWHVKGDKTIVLPAIEGASGSRTSKGVSCSKPSG